MELPHFVVWIQENIFLSFWVVAFVFVAVFRHQSDRKNWGRLAEKYRCETSPKGLKTRFFQTGRFGHSPHPNSLKVGMNKEGLYIAQMLTTRSLFIPWTDLRVRQNKVPLSKSITFFVRELEIEFTLLGKAMGDVELYCMP